MHDIQDICLYSALCWMEWSSAGFPWFGYMKQSNAKEPWSPQFQISKPSLSRLKTVASWPKTGPALFAFSTTKTTTPLQIMSSFAAGVTWIHHRPKLQSVFSSEECLCADLRFSMSVCRYVPFFFILLTSSPEHIPLKIKKKNIQFI